MRVGRKTYLVSSCIESELLLLINFGTAKPHVKKYAMTFERREY